ncbi:MAG: formate dehydrogenase subunit delta [Maricaulaceae bacterium]|nr:formate dehydrogenase subunit delta [Maricaulaceae bacterium]
MREDTLIRMANQIADYFEAYPEDEAIEGVAGHLKNFWEPRMREQLKTIAAKNGAALHPLALKAAEKLG